MNMQDAAGLDPTVAPYTCTQCGCLCDDILLEIESGRVVEARHACEKARAVLVRVPVIAGEPVSARIEGIDVAIQEAVQECARILAAAQAPLILGLDQSTNETVRFAVGLADQLGATVEIGDARAAWARIGAMQRAGSVGASLGEVKARADVVVFWACDPATTHPRHFERYSIDAPGRFIEGARRVVVMDEDETPTARRADIFLQTQRGRELALLNVLCALLRGGSLEADRVEKATGHRLEPLRAIAETLRAARYGTWFTGACAGRGGMEGAEARCQAVTGLVRDLARRTRFVSLGLGEPGNAHGAEGVMAWQSGFAPGLDFGAGFPESLPGETSASARLAQGEFDAAVVVGGIPEGMLNGLATRPWIFIGPPEHPAFNGANVALPAGTAGIDDSGTFTRVDGVSLPVRAIRPARNPGEREWLEAIGQAVAALKAGAGS